MSSSIPELSALRCIQDPSLATSTESITQWTIEKIDNDKSNSNTHPHFNAESGIYTIPKDGIYLVTVQIIPIGGATLQKAHMRRERVKYALKISDPAHQEDYRDVGCHSFGEMDHFRAGSILSCVRLAGATARECIRFNVYCLQRKEKQERKILSRKEKKRRKRAAEKAARVERECDDVLSDNSSESEWHRGFESDCSREEGPRSAKQTR